MNPLPAPKTPDTDKPTIAIKPQLDIIGATPNPSAPEIPSVKNSHTRLKLIIVAAAIVMIGVSSGATVIVSRNSISSWDTLAADNSASELRSDVSNINTKVYSVQSTSSLPDFSQLSSSISTSITDAQRQYSELSTSPVLKSEQVSAKFISVKQKWNAYAKYVQGVSGDYKTLGPLLVQLNNAQQSALSMSRQPASSLGTELIGYKNLLDAVGQQSGSLKMQTNPDSQLLNQLDTYISSTNKDITNTQSDLSQRANLNKVSADITDIATVAATFSNDETSWGSQSYSNLQQLDPSAAIKTYDAALSAISKNQN